MSSRLAHIVVILLSVSCIGAAQPSRQLFSSDSLLLFVPFKDVSGFSGTWDLSADVPRFAAAYMQQRFRIGVVSPIAVRTYASSRSYDPADIARMDQLRSVADRFRTRFLVTAQVTEFSITRFIVSEVQLAGYESFAADVKIRFTLYDAAQFGGNRSPVLYEGDAEGSVKDRGLGVTLFGKRTDRMNKYFALDEIAFGSEAFVNTIIGEALLKCMDDLGGKLERAIPALVSKNVVLSTSVIIDSSTTDPAIAISRKLLNGEIVMVDEEDVFINLGSADGIAVGDLLPVYGGEVAVTDPGTGAVLGTRDERIGELQVIEIRAEHLSLATITAGKGAVKPKQKVRKVFVR
jgi:hypothetical protein